jgi:hypothetical protein
LNINYFIFYYFNKKFKEAVYVTVPAWVSTHLNLPRESTIKPNPPTTNSNFNNLAKETRLWDELKNKSSHKSSKQKKFFVFVFSQISVFVFILFIFKFIAFCINVNLLWIDFRKKNFVLNFFLPK